MSKHHLAKYLDHPLSRYMVDAGLTQVELAKKIGITPQYIHYIVSGRRWPSYNLARELFKFTGVPIDTLLLYGREI